MVMLNRKHVVAGLIAAASASVLYAATPAERITERQDNFKAIGRANKAIRDELAKTAPNFAVVQANARTLHVTARRQAWLFPRGTGPESGAKTAALPIIWTQFSDFRVKHIQFSNAARELEVASRSNNAATIRTSLTALGGACKACHDVYRKPA